MTNLSDVTQDILDVMWFDHFETALDKRYLAADIIRVVADQVVPPALEEEFFDRNHSLPLQKMVEIRLQLLAIAAELEGSND